MSIQTQIDRLQTAKTDLITQIAAKGVTVPMDASLDELADLVRAIETGKDVSAVTATETDVVKPKVFVDAQGNVKTGVLEPVIRYEGEFVASYDSDYKQQIDCGFKPDAVMFTGLSYTGAGGENVYQEGLCVLFSESTPGAIPCFSGYGELSTGAFVYFESLIHQTNNGFILQHFCYYDENDDTVYPTGKTFSFVAIKYTESIPAEFDTSVITATPVDVVYPKVFIDSEGVTRAGSLRVQTYYYGADEPSADLGVDGDLYFVMG